MKHPKWLRFTTLLLSLLILTSLLPVLNVNAALEDPTKADVTIALMDSPYKARFPDIVLIPQDKLPAAEQADYPNGKLLVAFYKNINHTPDTFDLAGMGRIQVVESKDNGRTWSQPKDLMTAQMLIDYGIATDAAPLEARDPNFAILHDGTVIFTFFTRRSASDSYVKAYIMYSRDGANTWSAPTLIPSALLNKFYAKRGDIAVFDDNQMLIPLYGQGTTLSSWAAVNILATLKPDGTWSWDEEYFLADKSTTNASISEVSLVATATGDTVYALAREPGIVWQSDDRGATWTQIGREIIENNGRLDQPGLKLLPDGSILATWAAYKTSYPGRPIYAKRFFPELGWDATTAQLVYWNAAGGDMADPSSCLLPNGEVLIPYYVTKNRTISGTFLDPDDLIFNLSPTAATAVEGTTVQLSASATAGTVTWSSGDETLATVDSNGLVTCKKAGTVTITANAGELKRTSTITITEAPYEPTKKGAPLSFLYENFESSALGTYDDPDFTFNTQSRLNVLEEGNNKFLRFAAQKVGTSYKFGQLYSANKVEGDYSAQFHFRFHSASAERESQELYVSLLHTSGVAVCHLRQTGIVFKIDSSSETVALDKNFEPGKWYTIRVSRAGDGLYARTWEKGTPEPDTWELYYKHSVITNTGKFRLGYLSYNATDQYLDIDDLVLSRRSVAAISDTAVSATLGDAAKQLTIRYTPDVSAATPTAPSKVIWTSSDPQVATVTDGLVTFAGAGSATITAATENGVVLGACNVNVHAHVLTPVAPSAASCTEPGNTAYYSCECGIWYSDAEGKNPIGDHNLVVIPATGHSHSTDWSFDAQQHYHVCSCGDKADAAEHRFQWIIDKPASAGEAGSKHEECEICGYAKNPVEIPNPATPPTGDSSRPDLWIGMAIVSALGLVTVAILGKKYRNM